MAFGKDVVGARPFACWCHPCCTMRGPGKGMNSGHKEAGLRYCVGGCASLQSPDPSYAKGKGVPVARCDARGIAARRKAAQEAGRQVAETAKVGQFCAAQKRTDRNDQYAVGVRSE